MAGTAPLRVLFAGSPGIAVPSLRRLAALPGIAAAVGVLTNPESRKGRGLQSSATPVALAAASLFGEAFPVLAPDRLGAEAREAVASLGPDLLVSFAYGRIFGPKFLALFPRGGLNIHPSLLPRWRGPTPIPAAILHRDPVSGVCVQRLAPGVDEGDILASGRIELGGRETQASLSDRAAELGADLLAAVLGDLAAGRETARPQEGEALYCGLLGKDDGLVDWGAPVLDIDAFVRAFDPWPGAFTWFRGQRLAILEAEALPGAVFDEGNPGRGRCASVPVGAILGVDKSKGLVVQGVDGLVALKRLQLQHKKALGFREFANGVRDLAGTPLGSAAGTGTDR